MRYTALALFSLTLISCNRDPNYLKQKYLDSGNKYFDAARYKEASIMYRKSVEADRKFGMAYYRLALTSLKLSAVPNAVPALRRAYELLPPGTPEANDTTLKLSEIMILASQGQANSPILKDVKDMVAGLLKRNANSWEGHKLTGDLDMVDAAALYRNKQNEEGKALVATATAEYRTALAARPGDPVITLALGRTLLLAGQSDEAEKLFRSLIAKDKANLNGYYELYRVYLSQRKLPEAEAILKQAIAANPKDTQLRLTLAQYYFGTSKRTELVALLDQMKSDLKNFPDAYMQSGDFFLRVNATDEAIKEYEAGIQKDSVRKIDYLKHEIEAYIRAGKPDLGYAKNQDILKMSPKDPEARGLKATFLLDKGDVTQAIGELQASVTAKPNNFVNRFNLGRAHFARGEYEQARQEFDTAIQIRPDYLPARLAAIQVAMIRGDNDAALKLADDTIRISPASSQATVMKAAALQRLGRFDEARGLLTAVLQKNPKQVEGLLEMGILNMNQKKPKDAEVVFREAYEADPNNLRGLLGESRALLVEGQAARSVEIVEAEAQKHPDRVDLQRELGTSEMIAAQYDKAIATFQGLLAKVAEPRAQADLWMRSGQAYLSKGDKDQAVNSYEKARQLDSNNSAITSDLAQLYDKQRKPEVAKKYYELAVKQDPNNALALNNLAYLISESNGDLDVALTYATRAKQKLPKFAEISDTLGWIYLKKNLTDNAVDTFRSLTQLAPTTPVYHYHYAMALMQKGNRDLARKECQAALSTLAVFSASPSGKTDIPQITAAQIQELLAKLG